MEGCGLAALPPAVQGFTLLRALSLAHNRLASLPEGLRHLAPRLEALDVSFNGLAALPPVLAQLTLLRRLYVQQQRLSAEAVAPLALRLAGQSEPIGEWSCCLYSHCADLPSDLTSLRSLECMGIDTDPHIRSAVLEQLQARKVVVVQSRAGSLLPPGENGV